MIINSAIGSFTLMVDWILGNDFFLNGTFVIYQKKIIVLLFSYLLIFTLT